MKNEKGMTLVEVLAALIILVLVITVFLQFLPQLATTNKKNVEKNQAINLAEVELLHWKDEISAHPDTFKASAQLKNCSFDNNKNCYVVEKENLQDDQYNKNFYVSINYQQKPEEGDFDKIQAHRLHLEIKSRENDTKVSEAFGFVYLQKGD